MTCDFYCLNYLKGIVIMTRVIRVSSPSGLVVGDASRCVSVEGCVC